MWSAICIAAYMEILALYEEYLKELFFVQKISRISGLLFWLAKRQDFLLTTSFWLLTQTCWRKPNNVQGPK